MATSTNKDDSQYDVCACSHMRGSHDFDAYQGKGVCLVIGCNCDLFRRVLMVRDDSEPEPPDEVIIRPVEQWWMQTAWDDLVGFAPKLAEYGANDLEKTGQDLCEMMGWHDAPARVHSEVGCWFYLRGKVARAMEALGRHELPSDDTCLDTTVYSMMIRRVRNKGELS